MCIFTINTLEEHRCIYLQNNLKIHRCKLTKNTLKIHRCILTTNFHQESSPFLEQPSETSYCSNELFFS